MLSGYGLIRVAVVKARSYNNNDAKDASAIGH